MLRRRMMMEHAVTQDWDVAWDYTMGLPEDNGFEKILSGTTQIEMTDDGLEIAPSGNSSDYVRYSLVGFETCNEGICEAEVLFYGFADNNGFRMILSDGDAGLQIYCVSRSLRYNVSSATLASGNNIAVSALETNILYKIKIVRESGLNTVFLDDEKVYETDVLSSYYTFGNIVFFQNNGSYLFKSLKFKKIS